MLKQRIKGLFVILIGALVGFFLYQSEILGTGFLSKIPFRLGLDLSGGTHLVFEADTSKTPENEIKDAMNSLRDTIERRVNVFGVSEPLVQVEDSKAEGREIHKLIVELPGTTDVSAAAGAIGKTPKLEFKLLKNIPENTGEVIGGSDLNFETTELTGKYLKRADVQFSQNSLEPSVLLTFNDEGQKLFSEITKNNVGSVLGIFLDDSPLSLPVIREEIRDGKAQITGSFSVKEAQTLVRDLNYGALPLPVNLVGSEAIGPTLGIKALQAGIFSGVLSFILIIIFLVLWYRLPGFVASLALIAFVMINLIIFKAMSITLTTAGIAGFILSIGMAVDANILIFERMKEEMKKGLGISEASKEGFKRAWLSIRDSNTSSIITATILYYFAGSPFIKGFALVFGIGVITSMFSSITISRTLLYSLTSDKESKLLKFFFSNGLNK